MFLKLFTTLYNYFSFNSERNTLKFSFVKNAFVFPFIVYFLHKTLSQRARQYSRPLSNNSCTLSFTFTTSPYRWLWRAKHAHKLQPREEIRFIWKGNDFSRPPKSDVGVTVFCLRSDRLLCPAVLSFIRTYSVYLTN